jgi:hypothetical protein
VTLRQALDHARQESKNGFVQHVNRVGPVFSRGPMRDPNPREYQYLVSDWYDASTVKSFENGREL